ncbi:Hypothetical predicted protein [Pelobates cultripes]|uniref:Uncharacterized protein n=1 Tax=Pelobates cultripes TaxID=61616 RepID=A0AAD1R3C1_PELCU|nr:Hypothetical predicted protein [Pelobates cultripes]
MKGLSLSSLPKVQIILLQKSPTATSAKPALSRPSTQTHTYASAATTRSLQNPGGETAATSVASSKSGSTRSECSARLEPRESPHASLTACTQSRNRIGTRAAWSLSFKSEWAAERSVCSVRSRSLLGLPASWLMVPSGGSSAPNPRILKTQNIGGETGASIRNKDADLEMETAQTLIKDLVHFSSQHNVATTKIAVEASEFYMPSDRAGAIPKVSGKRQADLITWVAPTL